MSTTVYCRALILVWSYIWEVIIPAMILLVVNVTVFAHINYSIAQNCCLMWLLYTGCATLLSELSTKTDHSYYYAVPTQGMPIWNGQGRNKLRSY